MNSVPINIVWDNRGFQYMASQRPGFAGGDHSYKYMVCGSESPHSGTQHDVDHPHNIDYIQMVCESGAENLKEDTNLYYALPETGYEDAYLPSDIRTRIYEIYIPWFKINNYRDADYVIKFSARIAGVEVVIGCYRITKEMYLAAPYTIYKENVYAEKVSVPIIDPKSLIYGEDWAEWRENVCGCPQNLNNTGSSLTISLAFIERDGDHYTIISNSSIGSYNIGVSDQPEDFMHLDIGFADGESDIEVGISYNPEFPNLEEYLARTYDIVISPENLSIEYVLAIVKGEDDDIGVIQKAVTPEMFSGEPDPLKAMETCMFMKTDMGISDWSEYVPGMHMISSANVMDGENVAMTISSSPMALTPDVYKYLIITDLDTERFINNHINLSNSEMLNYIIHAVNKINKNVIQVENAKDYKSNIIKPVFFRAYDINDTIIHPQVTENICLDLNSYKSKVGFFYLKIEDTIFSEIGRNHNGVIFKVQGYLLPNKASDGLLYVLNEDKEMVTTGNYKYMQ